MPPSKKPILTILKQARAFGLGLVLATQNPVDIDYKAISNAGTWMIGRLQTERDKARLLDGMSSAGGTVDVKAIDEAISGLGKRQFVLHDAKEPAPKVFGTRWAMSYLRGPLTRDQIGTLMADAPERSEAPVAPAATGTADAGAATAGATGPAAGAVATPPAETLADDESTVMPTVADGIDVRYLSSGAPWTEGIAVVGGRRLQAGVCARVNLLYDDTKADLRETQEYEFVWFPVDNELDPDRGIAVDYDDRDFRTDAPADALYVIPDAKIQNKTYFSKAQTALKDHLYRTLTLQLFTNSELKLYSRPGETREEFAERAADEAQRHEDEELSKLRDKLETKQDRLQAAAEKAEDRVRELEADKSSRSKSDMINVGTSILGSLLGGRKSGRGLASAARRVVSGRGQTQRTGQRLETAENRLEAAVDDLEKLEEELTDLVYELDEKWRAIGEQVEPVEITLEKNDITVEEVVLVWFPTE